MKKQMKTLIKVIGTINIVIGSLGILGSLMAMNESAIWSFAGGILYAGFPALVFIEMKKWDKRK